jgi:hypothetical protein
MELEVNSEGLAQLVSFTEEEKQRPREGEHLTPSNLGSHGTGTNGLQ